MKQPTRVIHYGLGPVGCSIVREVHRRSDFLSVGGIDRDRDLIGRDLGEIAGINSLSNLTIMPEASSTLAELAPDVAALATSSSLQVIRAQILGIVREKVNVISTCEELVFPWTSHPDLAAELDEAAKRNGVSILGTGVNPGFIMDYLVAVLSGLTREVKSVKVERVLNASVRRMVFQKKIGVGMSQEEFQLAAAAGSLRHVGLKESVEMIAQALNWRLSRVDETIKPVLADDVSPAGYAAVSIENIIGVEQVATGFDGSASKIVLRFKANLGEANPRDRIIIDGVPPIDLTIEGGVHGDQGTCNVIVNAIRPLVESPPGLRTMLDIRAPAWQEPKST